MTSPHSTRRTLPQFLLFVLAAGCLFIASTATVAAATTTYRTLPGEGARLMWQTGPGYCGEASLQTVGIQMGFWVGERQADGLVNCKPGCALLGVNYDALLSKLHLRYTDWSGGTSTAAAQNFLAWIRDAQIAGYPVIFGVKTHDTWGTDPDYDHIMNTSAVTTTQLPGGPYTGSDSMLYLDSIDATENVHTFGEWLTGHGNVNQYYYLPPPKGTSVYLTNGKKVRCNGYQYGVKITGQDGSGECLPISMTPVTPASEPNVTQGGTSAQMSATVHMNGLTAGKSYALLRWDVTYSSIGTVPWSNILASATATNYEYRFTATTATAEHHVTFMSDGITFFRLCATN
jgi:hypothetical protein